MKELLINLQKTMGNLMIFTSLIVTALYILLKIPKTANFFVAKRQGRTGKIIATIILSISIMIASKFALSLVAGGARVNIRDSIAIFAAILSGPIVGIIVGMVGGIYRITLGGWTALPCGLATITISLIAAYIAKYKNYRINTITIKQIKVLVIITGLWEIIHTMIYCPFLGTKPVVEAVALMAQRAVIPMTVTNVIAVAVFLLISRDAVIREKSKKRIEEYSKMLEKKVKERTKEVEEKVTKLRESQGKYKAIVDNTHSRIVIIDSNYRILFINNEWLKYVKYEPNLPCYKVIAGLDSPCPFCKNEEVINKGKTVYFDQQFPDGSICSVCNVPLKDANGNIAAKMSIATDITERKHAEEQVKTSLREKEILLKEIHHRVKNNMQIVVSLLRLQSRYIKDKNILEMFRDSQSRIKSMALVHEKLYQSKNLANIDFAEYIRGLTGHLLAAYRTNPENIKLTTNVEKAFIDIDRAIPSGLIINELITNALKYAFPEDRKGEISVELSHNKNGKAILTVSDNGIGFPEDLDFRNTDSLGMQLVCLLTQQIGGTIELDRSEGTTFKIVFEPK